eukprot:Gb_10384 [translate_table: standard]
MDILKGNVTTNAIPIISRYLRLSDVIDGQVEVMIFSAGIPPSTSNYSLASLRCGFSSFPQEVSPLVLVFSFVGERSTGPETLSFRIVLLFLQVMGGDPLITEPSVIKIDDDVKEILEKAGLLDFFRKFTGFNESISRQVAESWDEGKVKVDGLVFTILKDFITEASGLSLEGEIINREKTNQIEQLTKFIREDETFCWLQSGIARESLPAPWDRVVIQIMKYLTLEVKVGKGKLPLHQGLLKLLVNCEKARNPSPSATPKGLLRPSGTPMSRAQLLLGPTAVAPKSSVESSESEEEEDSPSEDCRTSGCKKGSTRKRKPAPQTLAASLAKCNRRSARLKEKSAKKIKIVDYISSEEEKSEGEDTNLGDQHRKEKVSVPLEDNKDSAKSLSDNQTVLKELRSHLKILNGLGGSLTGTCACINLLSLEIANYLKEVVNRLKELNSGRP